MRSLQPVAYGRQLVPKNWPLYDGVKQPFSWKTAHPVTTIDVRKKKSLFNFTGYRYPSETIVGVVENDAWHLAEGHLGRRRPLRALSLTPTHRRLRLEWWYSRGICTAAEWNQVVFSDESRFMWRPRGEHPQSCLCFPIPSTAGVMVWGATVYNTR
ncbi:transposable element Tcb1 transposase [Trichonephila clavipes]|nr:transposable element Tcb1 transposase [Trichonephila clavipes]